MKVFHAVLNYLEGPEIAYSLSMAVEKKELHSRNRHRGRYDFNQLIRTLPELRAHVRKNEYGDESIDFADPEAVKSLNCAILKEFYGICGWDIPKDYLCPPIPGRADYIHQVADLLADGAGGEVPRGPSIRVLDIGIGANAVYPIIGQHEYGWSFVGTETDRVALASVEKILSANPELAKATELRVQKISTDILTGIIFPGEKFDLVICNPPFHASLEESQAGSRRKWQNLGKGPPPKKGPIRVKEAAPVLNFGGHGGELWCVGGEVGFITRMITESVKFKDQVKWFTSLVSREIHLPVLYENLERAKVVDGWTMDMAQGQKKSRILTWSFQKHSSYRGAE